jgi:multiple sugar transport system substrate-binding protein
LAVLGTAIALAAGLTGCAVSPQGGSGPGGTSTTLSNEPVTISMYWWGGDDRIQRTQKVIKMFQDKYPNIKVEPTYGDWTSYWEKLATMVAGGNIPDVIQMDQLYLASYAQRGVLAELNQPQLDLTTMSDSVVDTGKWGDKVYGASIASTGFGVLANKDALDKLGIALPDDSKWTWDDYATWTKSISDASGGTIRGTGVMQNEFQLQLFARQLGDQLFKGSELVIKPETLAKYFQASLDWVESGSAPSASATSETINATLDQTDLVTGKAATMFIPSTMITTTTAAANGANLVLLELPHFADAPQGWEYMKPGMYWSQSSKSAHPAEAALLINYFINDPEAAKVLGTERGIPSSSSALDAITPSLEGPPKAAVDFVEGLHFGAAPAIIPTGASDLQPIIQRYCLAVIAKQQTPSQAAEALIAEVGASVRAAQ